MHTTPRTGFNAVRVLYHTGVFPVAAQHTTPRTGFKAVRVLQHHTGVFLYGVRGVTSYRGVPVWCSGCSPVRGKNYKNEQHPEQVLTLFGVLLQVNRLTGVFPVPLFGVFSTLSNFFVLLLVLLLVVLFKFFLLLFLFLLCELQ